MREGWEASGQDRTATSPFLLACCVLDLRLRGRNAVLCYRLFQGTGNHALWGHRLISSMIRAALAALAGVTLAACVSSSALEPQNQPLSSRAARIYILRPPAVPMAIAMAEVKINDAEVGSVAVNSYLFVDRPPGRYKISTAIYGDLEHEIEVAAGRTYYVAINVRESYATLGNIPIRMEGSNVGRPVGQPSMLNPSWLSEVDANTATSMMARMKPPK